MDRVILGSGSPRRRVLLELLGVPFAVLVADVDEESVWDVDPAVDVVKTAVLKASHLANMIGSVPPTLLICADTTVALQGQMLGKPADAAAARQMLRQLRARSHEVHTGMVLHRTDTGESVELVATAQVMMRDYSDAEIDAYIATGDPLDKAGAYGIQHPVFQPVAMLDGCFTGVMGLSVCQLMEVLTQWGMAFAADLTAVSAAHQQYPCPFLPQFSSLS